nr:GtrA family protein [Oenococcus oeni]
MKNFFNKNYEIILYLIFGILTTVVYFIARFLTLNLSKNALLAVAVAQILAILFAFITNKIWVFKKSRKGSSFDSIFKVRSGAIICLFTRLLYHLALHRKIWSFLY